MTKHLLLNLATMPAMCTAGLPKIDNIEGFGFGPELPNGRRSLMMVSDNFNSSQITQFLDFEVLR